MDTVISNSNMYKLLTAVAFLAFMLFVLSACSGGGDDAPPPPPPPPPPPATYTISGQVSGGIIEGVTIKLFGTASATTTTDNSGNFSFSGLSNGNYALNAYMTDYTFSPVVIYVTVADADVANNNFTAIGDVAGTISGAIVQDVQVTLTGPESTVMHTLDDGKFRFQGLPPGSYIIAPFAAGYTFDPLTRQVDFNGVAAPANDFTSSASVTYTISGTVTGDIQDNVKLILSYTASGELGQTYTRNGGQYSFDGVPAGNDYTVTPVRPDYTFDKDFIDIPTLNANSVGNDFTTTTTVPPLPRYTVTGTFTYAGSETGNVFLQLEFSGGYQSEYGTTVTIGSPGTYDYAIRGVPEAQYRLYAYLDALDTGAHNAGNPFGQSDYFDVNTTPTLKNVVINDTPPPTPEAPTVVIAFPGDQGAVLLWDIPVYSNGYELGDSYDIYWHTDPNVGPANHIGSALDIPPYGDDLGHYLISGLNNGQSLYFAVRSKVGSTASIVTASDPISIGQPTGGYTVSGDVSYPAGTATNPLYILLVNLESTTPKIYFRRYATPTPSPHSFTVSGVPNGSYDLLTILDMNDSGRMDTGDMIFRTEDELQPVIVNNADTSRHVSLNDMWAIVNVPTNHFLDSASPDEIYSLHPSVAMGTKRPIKVTLTGGPSLTGPIDFSTRWDIGRFEGNSGVIAQPVYGDLYTFEITFSDYTTTTRFGQVIRVLDLPIPLAPAGLDVPGDLTPVFSWELYAIPTGGYVHQINLYSSSSSIWDSDDNIPATSTSVPYNYDGRASQPILDSGTDYWWHLNVIDLNRNRATVSTPFTTQ